MTCALPAIGAATLIVAIGLNWLDARRLNRTPVKTYPEWKQARERHLAELAAAQRAIEDAQRRNDCKAVGQGRQRLRNLRMDGLRREVVAKMQSGVSK